MKRSVALIAAAILCIALPLQAETGAEKAKQAKKAQATQAFKTEMDKISYAIGVQIGKSMKQDGLAINPAVLSKAISDVFAGKGLAMSDEQIMKTISEFQRKLVAKKQAEMKDITKKNLAAGEAFLAANVKKEGVKVVPSGLQYKVIEKGTGPSPDADDSVKVHYEGKLIDGTVFDSSYKRGEPAEFEVGQVIKGWSEALQLMKQGAKWKLFIPANLAYGERGAGGTIPPNAVLTFDVELLDVIENNDADNE